MTLLNIICVIIIAISCGTIIFVRLHKLKKNNNTVTVDTIIEEYGDDIIEELQNFIKIMQTKINDYPTKEDYIADLISLCVDSIQDNCELVGIDANILKFIDREQLAETVAKILESNKIECFSILPFSEIINNEKYFDEEVVEALTVIEEEEIVAEEPIDTKVIDDFSNSEGLTTANATTDFEPYTVTVAEEKESYVVAETPEAESFVVAETPEVEALGYGVTEDAPEITECDSTVIEEVETPGVLEAESIHVEETVDDKIDTSTNDTTENVDE